MSCVDPDEPNPKRGLAGHLGIPGVAARSGGHGRGMTVLRLNRRNTEDCARSQQNAYDQQAPHPTSKLHHRALCHAA
jgi:hypothetical protein